MEFREGQLLKFSRSTLPPREVAQVEQVDKDEDGETVAVWLSSPYQPTEPLRVKVSQLVQVEELAELPAVKPKKKRPDVPSEDTARATTEEARAPEEEPEGADADTHDA